MKKKILGLLLILCLSLVTFTDVYALKVTEAGANVNPKGSYDSTRLVAGNTVDDQSTVDGISFVAGNQVIFGGNSTYGLYAGNSLSVKGTINRDLFIAGNSINLYSESSIGRDAYIAGNIIKISGTIGRNLNVGGTSIDLSGAQIAGNVYVASEVVVLDENTVIGGKLTYDEDASITGLDKATVGNVEVIKIAKEVITINPIDYVYSFVLGAAGAFIVMLVLFYIMPKFKTGLDKTKFDSATMFKTLVIGLAILFFVPIAAIFALFTGFLTPLALIVLAIFLISIYVAYLVSYYIVGNLITTKLLKKDSVYLSLTIGIIVVKLAILIPVVGGFIALISLLYGLGLIFDFIKRRGEK